VTHEEAAEEAAATTEAGTAGAGTSAETPTWTLANLTAHNRARGTSSCRALHGCGALTGKRAFPSRASIARIRYGAPEPTESALNSRTKPTERHRHPHLRPVQKLLVAWLIPALMTCLTRAISGLAPEPKIQN